VRDSPLSSPPNVHNNYPVGVYTTSPITGRIVDARGPRLTLIAAAILLLVGYLSIRIIYDNGAPPSGSISAFTFWLLVICSFMTGAGGTGGLSSSVNVTAKSFPDRAVSYSAHHIFFVAYGFPHRELQRQRSFYQALAYLLSFSPLYRTPCSTTTHPLSFLS
jgi:MFS family permease